MSAIKRPQIGLVLIHQSGAHTGRTRSDSSARTQEGWLIKSSELRMIADVHPVRFSHDSVVSDPVAWLLLLKVVHQMYPTVDGIVIVDESDAAALTAVVMESLIERTGKPVVVVGTGPSNKSNPKSELINAVQAAATNMAGVVYVQGNSVLDVSHVQEYDPIEGGPYPIIGKVDFGIRLFVPQPKRSERGFRFRHRIESHIATIPWVADRRFVQNASLRSMAGAVIAGSPLVPLSGKVIKEIQKSLSPTAPVVLSQGRAIVPLPKSWLDLPTVPAAIARVWLMVALGARPKAWQEFITQRIAPL